MTKRSIPARPAWTLAAIAAAATFVEFSAFAADPPAPPPGPPPGGRGGMEARMFEQADKNKDGVITRDEAVAAATDAANRMFDRLDANKDGMLTQDELKQDREQRRADMQQRFDEHFKAADTNGDGLLSRAEAEKGMPMIARNFDAIDTNKDGQVSKEELQAFRDKMMRGGPGGMRGMGGKPGGHMHGQPPPPPPGT